jgi:two-component system sensor histidine kinase KdpD
MDTPIPVRRATGYVQATLACVATTVLTLPLRDVVDAANIVMIYLLVVALVAVRLGSGPAILAAFAAYGFRSISSRMASPR